MAQPAADIAISTIACYELYTGVEKCSNPGRERLKVDALIGALNVIAFDLAASGHAARIRAELESGGQMIGPYDVLIAAQAISLGLTLVTSNTNEFARISRLQLTEWK
jgi:tRNA(fMet)-specific endonuclease VapC